MLGLGSSFNKWEIVLGKSSYFSTQNFLLLEVNFYQPKTKIKLKCYKAEEKNVNNI